MFHECDKNHVVLYLMFDLMLLKLNLLFGLVHARKNDVLEKNYMIE
jgi:hypothetical protein